MKQHVADSMKPGDHGSTFAGNPLVTRAAETVVDIISGAHEDAPIPQHFPPVSSACCMHTSVAMLCAMCSAFQVLVALTHVPLFQLIVANIYVFIMGVLLACAGSQH